MIVKQCANMVSFIIIIGIGCVFSMDQAGIESNTPEDAQSVVDNEGWTQINNWQDAIPFANRIVAYKTTSDYFGKDQGYCFCQDPSIYYGFVESGIRQWLSDCPDGYRLYQLIKIDGRPLSMTLSNAELRQDSLFMRFATLHEEEQTLEAHKANNAKFPYDFAQQEKTSTLPASTECVT